MRIFGKEIKLAKKNKLIITIAIVLAVAVLVIDVGYHASKSLADGVDTLPAKTGSVDASIDTSAYIVRDEEYVYSDMTGNPMYYIQSGEKVAYNNEIAAIYYKSGGSYSLIATLERLNDMRNALVSASRQWDEATETVLNARISDVYGKMYECIREKRISDADMYRGELQALLCMKDCANGIISIGEAITECDKAIASVQEKIGDPAAVVKAQKAGWFYKEIDGYEERIDTDLVSSLSLSDAKQLFTVEFENMKDSSGALKDTADTEEKDGKEDGAIGDDEEDEEKEGDDGLDIYNERSCIGKLVTTETFNVVCVVSVAETARLSVGKTYKCVIGGFSVEMTLDRIIFEKGKSERALVLSCSTLPPEFEFERICEISIVYKTYEGIKIPISAVKEIDGIVGVYIKRGFIVQFREVVPIYAENGMMVVVADRDKASGAYRLIAENDNVILRGNGLYDGKILSR